MFIRLKRVVNIDEVPFVPLDKREYKPLGPESAKVIERADKYRAFNYAPYPFSVKAAEGPWLFDHDSNKALDFLSAYSAVLTHRHSGVIDAVMKEIEEGADLVSNALYTGAFADFVEALSNATGYERALLKSDGGSITETALKGMLIHAGERGIEDPNIILTEDYFHGRPIFFSASAGFDPEQKAGIPIDLPWVRVVRDSLENVAAAIDENTIGIFIETHKGEGGPLFSTKEHFLGIRNLAKEKGIFFGADEIQTGLGRCGYMMAWQEYGEEARPDFVTLGKALGGGIIPVSALAGSEEFMRIFTPGTEGSTWGGYPLACRAGCASLKYIVEEGIPERSIELGGYFAAQLMRIPGIRVENRGLLMRVEIEGINTAKYACLEMLLGEGREPRVFMKHGHYNAERNVAYTRIAPPPGAITKELIDYAAENTIAPVLEMARKG